MQRNVVFKNLRIQLKLNELGIQTFCKSQNCLEQQNFLTAISYLLCQYTIIHPLYFNYRCSPFPVLRTKRVDGYIPLFSYKRFDDRPTRPPQAFVEKIQGGQTFVYSLVMWNCISIHHSAAMSDGRECLLPSHFIF